MKNKIVFTLCLALLSLSSYSKTFILIHGAMTDGTVWFKLKPLLEAKGHNVVVVNLLGHGKDDTVFSSISYEKYVSLIIDNVNKQSEKVILVGHSMAGLLIASVAEKLPSKIESLVFIAAFMPQSGDSVFGLNNTDKQSQFGPNLIVSDDKSTATMKLESIAKVFCDDCNPEDKTLLMLSHKEEPLAPLAQTISLTKNNYGKIPKYSLITLKDNAVGSKLQQELVMQSENVKKVYQINSGHLPFLSQPKRVASILLSM